MSETFDLRGNLIAVAGAREWGDNRQSWLSRAARKAGITYRQARAIFYGENSDPKLSVAMKIHAAAQAEKSKQARQADAAHLLSIATALEQRDEEFHCTEIAALRDLASRIGCKD